MAIIYLMYCFTKYGTVPVQIPQVPQVVCKVILGLIGWIFVILRVAYLFKCIFKDIISSPTQSFNEYSCLGISYVVKMI